MGEISSAADVVRHLKLVHGGGGPKLDRDAIESQHRDVERKAEVEWDTSKTPSRAWREEAVRAMGCRLDHAAAQLLGEGTVDETKAVRAARAWLSRTSRPVLILSGTTGTGKSVASHLAGMLWVQDECEKRMRFYRSRTRPLVERVRQYRQDVRRFLMSQGAFVVPAPLLAATFDPWKGDTARTLPADHPFVIIDDLGTERSSERWTEAFGLFIDTRLSLDPAKSRLVITTNVAPREFRTRYGERIADRFNEHSMAVQLTGESLRGGQLKLF